MEKPIVILVHGFWDQDGVGTTDRLRPYFEAAGYEVEEWDYGWKGFLGVQLCNSAIGYGLRRFANYAAKDRKVFAVGHSNGCEVIRIATESFVDSTERKFSGAKFSQIALIDPALDSDAEFGPNVEHIHVFHNRADWVVEVAEYLPFHPWGNMGRVGYTGSDPRFENHELQGGGIEAHSEFLQHNPGPLAQSIMYAFLP